METEMIAGGKVGRHSDPATADEISRQFISQQEHLAWLAGFLTGREDMACACVIDASTMAAAQSEASHQSLFRWTRLASICSAVELQRSRIVQLAPSYERHDCAHWRYQQLSWDKINFLVEESDRVQLQLDALCRFALILCGVERCSSDHAALLLGVSRSAVEAAYCFAIERLDILHCQVLTKSCVCDAWN